MNRRSDRTVPAVLLLYSRGFSPYASTVLEHVNAFPKHSRFGFVKVNTSMGFPSWLTRTHFNAIVLHYSLFGTYPYSMDGHFYDYLGRSRSSYKIVFFQDEYRFCRERFQFIQDYKVDCVYSLADPAVAHAIYTLRGGVPTVRYTHPGYVDDGLINSAARRHRSDQVRSIDVGYRARAIPYYLGEHGQEKTVIAAGFVDRAKESGLVLDISCDPAQRIYGDAWHDFLANCRGCLGVEGGASVIDLEGEVYAAWKRHVAENPALSFREFKRKASRVLAKWERAVPYYQITPRHFEAAAFRVCQILFEGGYSGILKPMVHYIPLKKDFSNFDEALKRFKDPATRRDLTEKAYRDLIHSGRYSYKRFIRSFDKELAREKLDLWHRTHFSSRVLIGLANSEQNLRKSRMKLVLRGRARARSIVGRAKNVLRGGLALS